MPYKNIELNNATFNPQTTVKINQFYKGFSTVDPANQGSKLYDFDLIKQDILNHFNTRKGSRVMNPTFGTIVWDLIMEPLTDVVRDLLTEDITTICNFDPRVYLSKLTINEYEQGYLVDALLVMKSTNESDTLKLAFDQKVGLIIG